MKALANYIWMHLGRCPYCMRMSFIFAITSIAIAASSSLFLPKMAVALIVLCAIALTLLWVAHVTVYSMKALARHNKSAQTEAPLISRRKLFGSFAQIAAVAALSSAMPQMVFASPGGRSRLWCCAACVVNGSCDQDCQNHICRAKQTAKKKSS